MIALIPASVSFSSSDAPPAPVSLPDSQFPISSDYRNETAPRGGPIRAKRGWREDGLIDWAYRCAR